MVGEQPGREELKVGRPFVGLSGQLLDEEFKQFPDAKITFTNVIQHNQPGSKDDVLALHRRIERLQPDCVLALGELAQRALGLPSGVEANNGRIFPSTYCKSLVVACVHPAYVLRSSRTKKWLMDVALRQARSVLEDGAEPWKTRHLRGPEIEMLLNRNTPLAGFDIETQGLNRREGKILCIGVSFRSPNGSYQSCWFEWEDRLRKPLVRWLKSGVRVIQNAKYDTSWVLADPLVRLDIRDPMLNEWCIREDQSASLEAMSARYNLGKPYHWGEADKSAMTMSPFVGESCARDARAGLMIYERQMAAATPAQKELFRNMGRLALTVMQIERTGTLIDLKALPKLESETRARLAVLNSKLDRKWGLKNAGSPKQVAKLLYETLDLPVLEHTDKTEKGGGGNPSTDSDVLERMINLHPIIPVILEARKLKAKLSNVIEPWKALHRDGFLEPDVKVGRVRTGRLSCTNPNLQNIERDGPEKKLFISRFPKGCILQADGKQFELRITAEESGDAALILACKSTDPHGATARSMNVERQTGKQLNLALASGVSVGGLIHTWKFKQTVAARLWHGWHRIYPGVRVFHDRIIAAVNTLGYAENRFGRRRYFDMSTDKWHNQAKNFTMQSLGADLLYLMMIYCQEHILDKGYRSRQLVPVHDCLKFDVYPGEERKILKMCEAAWRSLPCKVPMELDYTWSDGREVAI